MTLDLTCLNEFYSDIDRLRSNRLGPVIEEPRETRNKMIEFLVNNIDSKGDVLDLFSGDAVVPMALMYLQKEKRIDRKISRFYLLDNNRQKGLELSIDYANHFELRRYFTFLEKDINNPGWSINLTDKRINSCFMIDSVNYTVPEILIPEIRAIAPQLYVVQAGEIGKAFDSELNKYFKVKKQGIIPNSSVSDLRYRVAKSIP